MLEGIPRFVVIVDSSLRHKNCGSGSSVVFLGLLTQPSFLLAVAMDAAVAADSVLACAECSGPFIECDGGQWCLFQFSKTKLSLYPCAWCQNKVVPNAEISKSVYRKVPHDLPTPTHICFPCVAGFLAMNSSMEIPVAKRYDGPCMGTLCVEAVAAIVNHRAGWTQLAEFSRAEFADMVKQKYSVAAGHPDMLRSGSPGIPTGPGTTLVDVIQAVQNCEWALVSRMDAFEEGMREELHNIKQRQEAMLREMKSWDKPSDSASSNSKSWWKYSS